MPLLSVAIVSYNVRGLLASCLRSLVDSPDPALQGAEIWVVDNASPDGSADVVRREFPEVSLIESETNAGFAAATNLALSRARGRYLLLLNPDAFVRPGAVQALVDHLEARPEVGVAGPRLVYPDGAFQHSAFRFPTLAMAFLDFFPLHHRLAGSRLNGRYPRAAYRGGPFPIDHPLGAAFLVRREAWEEVGPLDEGFFMYCEEIDWCIRARAAGWEAACVPAAEVVHVGGGSASQARPAMFAELHRSRFRLFRNHRGPMYRMAARWIVRLGIARERARRRREAEAGAPSSDELAAWSDAYHQVWALAGE